MSFFDKIEDVMMMIVGSREKLLVWPMLCCLV